MIRCSYPATLTNFERYSLERTPDGRRVSDHRDETITVAKFAIFDELAEDPRDGMVSKIAIMDETGAVYATNSPSFIKAFEEILETISDGALPGVGEAVKPDKIRLCVKTAKKSGREFSSCVWVL